MELTYNDVQTINPNQPMLFNASSGCNMGCIYHRPESGIITLQGNNANSCFVQYDVLYNGNIAISEGETVGPIAVAIAINGEPILLSTAIVTPSATGDYFNVTSVAHIKVPRGCCYNISVENISPNGVVIDAQNSKLEITR